IAVLLISAPLFLWLAKGIFAPLERMTQTMTRVTKGDLNARNGNVGTQDEIGQVAGHLDDLLDQVQDRDKALRQWADELNARVEDRTAELRDANQKLQTTYKQLVMSEKLASIGEITAGVAHEINNPVAVIQGNVDVVRETLGPNAKDVGTELGLIDQQVGRITAMVSKLLQFARPGEYAGFGETVDLRPVVADCLVLVEHVLVQKDIQVSTDLKDVDPVRIDSGEMQQVVINLIINAAQAMGDNGVLTLRLFQEDRDFKPMVALQVSDTGPGLPDEMITSVFDPFFTTKLGEGTGLGLSISQTLVQQAGGLIEAENHIKGGAVFTVWLPVAEEVELAAQ
ncbi:MAG: ATP-binding protein, partial [Paracoccaceae bacterium]